MTSLLAPGILSGSSTATDSIGIRDWVYRKCPSLVLGDDFEFILELTVNSCLSFILMEFLALNPVLKMAVKTVLLISLFGLIGTHSLSDECRKSIKPMTDVHKTPGDNGFRVKVSKTTSTYVPGQEYVGECTQLL